MADVIVPVVPLDTIAYAKGGSIDWAAFRCLCLPDQMMVGEAARAIGQADRAFPTTRNRPSHGVMLAECQRKVLERKLAG